jgi:hypothetical protein
MGRRTPSRHRRASHSTPLHRLCRRRGSPILLVIAFGRLPGLLVHISRCFGSGAHLFLSPGDGFDPCGGPAWEHFRSNDVAVTVVQVRHHDHGGELAAPQLGAVPWYDCHSTILVSKMREPRRGEAPFLAVPKAFSQQHIKAK